MMLQLSEYQEKEGVFVKLLVQDNAKSMPPASWWASNGKGLPFLSSMARTVLAWSTCVRICCGWVAEFLTSVRRLTVSRKATTHHPSLSLFLPAKRNWSVYGRIKSGNRTRLRHHKADKLVYCHETLHLKLKLQKAGFKQEPITWESGSDSGEDSEAELEDLMI